MNRLIQIIEETADAFYQQKEKEGYEKLNQLIEELLCINSQALEEKLVMAMQALEKKDMVLLADILLYEIKPVLG